MPPSLASVYSWKGLEKSGRARTGASVRACFRVSKAIAWLAVQIKSTPFLSRSVKGLAITA